MSISITQATKAVKAALSAKTLSLFRRMCRESAVVTKIYELPLTPAEVRHLVGLHFRANAGVTEPRIVESLLIKAELELDETMNQWKQRAQLLTLLKPRTALYSPVLDDLEDVERDDFIDRFCDGNDSDDGEFGHTMEREWQKKDYEPERDLTFAEKLEFEEGCANAAEQLIKSYQASGGAAAAEAAQRSLAQARARIAKSKKRAGLSA